MPIALTHGGSNIYVSPEPARELLVGTKDGVVIFERTAAGWMEARCGLTGSHISAIAIEPTSGTIFAGAFFGTIYASEDGGRSWERSDNGLTVDDIYSLAWVRRPAGVRLYAGTQPAHLFFSDDLGGHWTELPNLRSVPSTPTWSFPGPPHVAHTKFITFAPDDPDTIYACIEQGALLKSSDAGQSWRELNSVGFMNDKNRRIEEFYDVHKALPDPRNPNRILVTGGAGLYVTPDGGQHWARWMSPDWAEDVYPDGFVLNPRRPDQMFLSAADHNPGKWPKYGRAGGNIFRTSDGGRSWERLRGGLPEDLADEIGALCLESWGDSCSVFAATTGGEVFGSDDAGEHWTRIASGLAPISKKGHDRISAGSW